MFTIPVFAMQRSLLHLYVQNVAILFLMRYLTTGDWLEVELFSLGLAWLVIRKFTHLSFYYSI